MYQRVFFIARQPFIQSPTAAWVAFVAWQVRLSTRPRPISPQSKA